VLSPKAEDGSRDTPSERGYLDLDEGRMGLDTKELIFAWKNIGIFK
jgi:hypothetical protein